MVILNAISLGVCFCHMGLNCRCGLWMSQGPWTIAEGGIDQHNPAIEICTQVPQQWTTLCFSVMCSYAYAIRVQSCAGICVFPGNWGPTDETVQLRELQRIHSWGAWVYPSFLITLGKPIQQSILIYWWLFSCFAEGVLRFPVSANLRHFCSTIMFHVLWCSLSLR